MRLDGIVLDLDDTLYESTRHLLPWADRRAAETLAAAGFPLPADEVARRIAALRGTGGATMFADLVRGAGADARFAEIGERAWLVFDPPPMVLDPDVARALDELGSLAPLALLTGGNPATQRRKVDRLGIGDRFVTRRFVASCAPGGKTGALREILDERGWTAGRTVVVGDRLDGDVRAGNRCGCLTVHVRCEGGEFASVQPELPEDVPWKTIPHVRELPGLLRA